MKKIVSLVAAVLVIASCFIISCSAASRQVIKVDYKIDRSDSSRTEYVNGFQLNVHDNSEYRWKKGDKLVYEVKISHDLKGLGVITAHFNPRGNMLSDVYVSNDVSLPDAVGKWSTASFEIPDTLGVDGVNFFAVIVAVTADENTPESFSAYFDKIRIERADGSVALSVFDSSKPEDVAKIPENGTGGLWGERNWIKTEMSLSTETTSGPLPPDTSDALAGTAVVLAVVCAGVLVIGRKRR